MVPSSTQATSRVLPSLTTRPTFSNQHAADDPGMPASLLTFKRKDSQHDVSVVDSVRSINRQLERQFPDCTCCVLVVADPGTVSEGVTIELETTRESLASVDWYRKQAEALGLALTGWKRGQAIGLESEATSTFLPMPDAALCFPG